MLGIKPIEPTEGLNARQNERRTVRLLLAEMLGCDEVELQHLPNGKPVLEGFHISISHTRGYAAVMLSPTHEVGIDIEYQSDRVKRIASRFLRDDEQPQQLAELLAYWSAKETLYKLYSEDQLAFHDMRITTLVTQPLLLLGENLKRGERIKIRVQATEAYTLTYAYR